jgi:hypothetical protein
MFYDKSTGYFVIGDREADIIMNFDLGSTLIEIVIT